MPARRTLADEVSRAAGKYLRLRCEEHFPTLPLATLSQIVSGGTPDTGEARYWDGDVVWLTPKDLGRPRPVVVAESERTLARAALSEGKARTVPKGTVLLSSRAPIGHLAIAGKDLATNQGFKNIICSDQLHNRFLFHVLRGSIAELEALGRGNTFLEIPAKVVKDFRIPVPPLALQIEAANLLDTIYVRMAGHDVALPPVSEPLSGLIGTLERIEAIAGKVEEARRLRGEAEEEAEVLIHRAVTKMIDAPNWDCRLLGDVLSEPPRNGLAPQAEVESDGRPMLRINAVSSAPTRYVDTAAAKQVSVSDAAAAPFVLRHDDVFIVRYNGDINRVAKAAIYKGDNHEGTVFPDKLMRLRPDRSVMSPDFLAVALSARRVRAQIEEIGKTTAGNIGISGADAKAFVVSVPPLMEQSRIVRDLEMLRHEIAAIVGLQTEATGVLDALLPAVLDKAFRGEM